MKIETQTLDTHEVKLTVEFEPETLNAAKQRAARKLARQTKIPGFRPGKAPYNIILRTVGEGAVLEEAIEIILEEQYPKIIEEAELKPYGPGRIDNIAQTDPLTVDLIVPLEAEVVLGDYKEVRRDYEPPEITEERVDEVLEDLRERQAVVEPVDRPAEPGDIIYIKLSAERLNPKEGQETAFIRERSVPILIESPDDDRPERQWPYPGFAQELIGLSANDEKTIRYTYPEDANYEALGGVEAEFKVVVEDVKKRTLPELNDEFADSLGGYESMETLRQEILKDLQANAENDYNREYDEEVINQAMETSQFKYPPQMLDDEIDSVIHSLEHRLAEQNLDMDLYLKTRNLDMEGLRGEAKEAAEKRLRRSLFLYEMARVENIELKPGELEQETMQTMQHLAAGMDEKERRRLSEERVFNNIVRGVMADLIAAHATLRMRSIASGIPEAEFEPEEEPGQDLNDINLEFDPSLMPAGEAPEGETVAAMTTELNAEAAETAESIESEPEEAPAEEETAGGAVENEAPTQEEEPKEGAPPAA